MLGIGGVTYTLSGGITESEATIADAITDLLFGFLEGATDEGFRVDAVSVGSGRLTLAAPSGATKDIPVDVVDASSVARVTLTSPDLPLKVATGQPIDAAAFMSDDRVIESPLCAWTLTPTSGSPLITDEGRDSLYVTADAAAAATVACVVGSANASLDVTWE
jgi:hypothetical protein